MSDKIWIRGEAGPFLDVTLVSEGAKEVVFERAGKKTTVAASDVKMLRHGNTPAAFDHALARMSKGDFAAAEKLLQPLEAQEGWVGVHAGFHRANARRLRAELEGTGHADALALLRAWNTKNAEHSLAPLAAIATGDAALVAKDYELAEASFKRLAAHGEAGALASRLGLARTRIASKPKIDRDITAVELEGIEDDAVAARNRDVLIFARITRAEALGKWGNAKKGLELLLQLLETPNFVHSPWHGRTLNTIAELTADLAGRNEDGSAKPEARVAAMYFINRAVRYTTAHPLERARTLALAVEANRLAGREDRAVMMKTELGRRFPTSTWAKAL